MHFKFSEPEKISQAKQRASVNWIIQKAHKNKVPGEFKDPYYKDYEGQEHLKPNIVHRLANADFYCSALANIYGDPSFHNLSHWNIIQSLARKGVYVTGPTDTVLTETVLIQTTPIKMSAHLAVIEAMMSLYIREVVIPERVVRAIQRIAGPDVNIPTPQDQEEALVLWINFAVRNLQDRIHQQEEPPLPVFPNVQDISDLIDGIGLCALVSYYCPLELNWDDISVVDPPSMTDSLYNIGLVIRFCRDSLPYNPCLVTKEDIVYMHSCVKQNILGFVAELFFLFELEPVSAVTVSHIRKESRSRSHSQLSSPGGKSAGTQSVRRSRSMNLTESFHHSARGKTVKRDDHHGENIDPFEKESCISDGEDDFVVKKARAYATLSDMMRNKSPTAYGSRAVAKEKYNSDTREEEDIPSERGRLSRRGSFRGSNQELTALPAAGLPTKSEEKRLYGRSRSRRNSISADESQLTIENFGGSQDNLNYAGRNPDKETYIHSGRIDDERRSSSEIRDVEKRNMHRQTAYDVKYDSSDSEGFETHPASFANLTRPIDGCSNVNIKYSEEIKAPNQPCEEKTSLIPLPNQTTWKQQSKPGNSSIPDDPDQMTPQVISSELHTVRMKLEEKRRRIESEKKKVEMLMKSQRQKLGKEAFMQAVVKGDTGNEVANAPRKWLGTSSIEEIPTPELDVVNYDEYQNSISQMTDSLSDIQTDLQRLSHQQNQIQSYMQNGMAQQQHTSNQFYLHDQQMSSPSRKMWGQGNDAYCSMSPGTRRSQWGPPARSLMPQGYDSPSMMSGAPRSSTYYPPYNMTRAHVNPNQLPPISHMGQPDNPSGFIHHGQPQSLSSGQQPPYYNPEQYSYSSPASNDSSRPSIQIANAPFRLHNDAPISVPYAHSQQPPRKQVCSSEAQTSSVTDTRQQKSPSPSRQSHILVAAPSPDDMAPQEVDFIETESPTDISSDKLKRLSISSGSRTYRIHEGSPTRPVLGTKTYRVPTKKGLRIHNDVDLPQPAVKERSTSPKYHKTDDNCGVLAEPLQNDSPDKGFYISFEDNSAPKRPKPQLRARKMSQKKASLSPTRSSKESASVREPLMKSNQTSADGSNEYLSLRGSNYKSPENIGSPVTTLSQSSSASVSMNPTRLEWRSQLPKSAPRVNKIDAYAAQHNRLVGCNGSTDDSSDFSNDGARAFREGAGIALVIDNELSNENFALSEMEKKKEKLLMQSMLRKQQQEEAKRKNEIESELKREAEKHKDDLKQRKKQEEKARREMILERHKIKKAIEEAEKEGRLYNPPNWYYEDSECSKTPHTKSLTRMRSGRLGSKPRPKTMHESSFSDMDAKRPSSRGQRGSSQNISESKSASCLRKNNRRWGSSSSLSRSSGSRGSTGSLQRDSLNIQRTDKSHSGRRPTSVLDSHSHRKRSSVYGSRDLGINRDMFEVHEVRRPSVAVDQGIVPRPNRLGYDAPSRKYRSTGSLYGAEQDILPYHMSEDSGLGRATPPRRAPSPGMSSRHFPTPAGPGSLPAGLFSRKRPGAFDDNASDISVSSSNMDYCGPRLFKQPTSKSNRPIIQNAVEHCVFPGVVNETAKQRVMDEIARSESKYFLFLFRDSGCQFRAIYSYNPETDDVDKIYGTGPKQVTDTMFEKFFKYNSGGKCFSQIHTRHLTVTIDAFTIYNSLWQGKRINLPPKKDKKLVI